MNGQHTLLFSTIVPLLHSMRSKSLWTATILLHLDKSAIHPYFCLSWSFLCLASIQHCWMTSAWYQKQPPFQPTKLWITHNSQTRLWQLLSLDSIWQSSTPETNAKQSNWIPYNSITSWLWRPDGVLNQGSIWYVSFHLVHSICYSSCVPKICLGVLMLL